MIEIPVIAVAQPPADASEQLGAFLKLVADPTRRRIFLLLMEGETCNCELTDQLGLPQNLISHHLKALRDAGLVRARRDDRDARWIYFSVVRDQLGSVTLEFQALFSPLALQERAPQCGPAAEGCGC